MAIILFLSFTINGNASERFTIEPDANPLLLSMINALRLRRVFLFLLEWGISKSSFRCHFIKCHWSIYRDEQIVFLWKNINMAKSWVLLRKQELSRGRRAEGTLSWGRAWCAWRHYSAAARGERGTGKWTAGAGDLKMAGSGDETGRQAGTRTQRAPEINCSSFTKKMGTTCHLSSPLFQRAERMNSLQKMLESTSTDEHQTHFHANTCRKITKIQ